MSAAAELLPLLALQRDKEHELYFLVLEEMEKNSPYPENRAFARELRRLSPNALTTAELLLERWQKDPGNRDLRRAWAIAVTLETKEGRNYLNEKGIPCSINTPPPMKSSPPPRNPRKPPPPGGSTRTRSRLPRRG